MQSRKDETFNLKGRTVSEIRQRPTCLANVGKDRYEPCGKLMRKQRNGITVCEDHGEMH